MASSQAGSIPDVREAIIVFIAAFNFIRELVVLSVIIPSMYPDGRVSL
jgi:hypothetical protein